MNRLPSIHLLTVLTIKDATNLFDKQWLVVATNKTFFLANTEEAAIEFSRSVGLALDRRRKSGRMLGADASDCSDRAVATCSNRGRLACRRAKHFRMLLREGATSWLWGCEVSGIATSSLHAARVAAITASGFFPYGASVGLRFVLSERADSHDPLII